MKAKEQKLRLLGFITLLSLGGSAVFPALSDAKEKKKERTIRSRISEARTREAEKRRAYEKLLKKVEAYNECKNPDPDEFTGSCDCLSGQVCPWDEQMTRFMPGFLQQTNNGGFDLVANKDTGKTCLALEKRQSAFPAGWEHCREMIDSCGVIECRRKLKTLKAQLEALNEAVEEAKVSIAALEEERDEEDEEFEGCPQCQMLKAMGYGREPTLGETIVNGIGAATPLLLGGVNAYMYGKGMNKYYNAYGQYVDSNVALGLPSMMPNYGGGLSGWGGFLGGMGTGFGGGMGYGGFAGLPVGGMGMAGMGGGGFGMFAGGGIFIGGGMGGAGIAGGFGAPYGGMGMGGFGAPYGGMGMGGFGAPYGGMGMGGFGAPYMGGMGGFGAPYAGGFGGMGGGGGFGMFAGGGIFMGGGMGGMGMGGYGGVPYGGMGYMGAGWGMPTYGGGGFMGVGPFAGMGGMGPYAGMGMGGYGGVPYGGMGYMGGLGMGGGMGYLGGMGYMGGGMGSPYMDSMYQYSQQQQMMQMQRYQQNQQDYMIGQQQLMETYQRLGQIQSGYGYGGGMYGGGMYGGYGGGSVF